MNCTWAHRCIVAVVVACTGQLGNGLVASLGAQQPQRTAPRPTLDASRQTALVTATSRVSPAVVSIQVQARRLIPRGRAFFDFFMFPGEEEEATRSFGTGFVLRQDGIIITNQHVVAGADSIKISLADGTEMPATLLGEDPTTDIAVLRVARRDLPVVTIGRSTDLMIGEWAIALGNPFTFLLGDAQPTVTAGVISATGRNILPSPDQPGMYLDMIQTDAAINPGNSGGPLVNSLGEVIGVNSSIFSNQGGSIGLGFAIPIERALRVADEIVRRGEIRRPWTGLTVEGASAMRDWKRTGGVLVTDVVAGGPAARAGIRAQSVLVEANGRPLRNFLDWEAVKLDLRVGDAVEVRVREGSRAVVARRIVTADLPTVTAEKVSVLRGIQLITVTAAIRSERRIATEQGALVFRVQPDIARTTGLRDGDVIVAINRTAVSSAAQVSQLLGAVRPRQNFRLVFERGGQVTFVDLSFQ
ncbi:MAG: trypsin-like peptidase domain-containing protein [Gemmatimonadota bacterium]|nr:trypsin-like peptidase domain-containing protein [Gemmatimonadota bacterium]